LKPAGRDEDNLRGSVWLIADMCFNVSALSIVKALGGDYPAAQIVILRALTGLILLVPWVWRDLDALRRINHWPLHLLRIGLSALTLTASFYAVARVPFALFTAINFTRPFLLMAMASLILREVIPRKRWLGACVGFLGVLIAVAPGQAVWSTGLFATFLTVVSGTVSIIITRQLRGTHPLVMMLLYTAGIGLATAPFALVEWRPIASGHVLPLLAVGVLSQCGQFCFLRAHWLGDAGVLGPLSYLSLVLSTTAGLAFFDEIPSSGTILGALVIVGSALAVSDYRPWRKRR
jgi:drug/metabolite transporter (DMT)-like permease